jgi:hypothetical protein
MAQVADRSPFSFASYEAVPTKPRVDDEKGVKRADDKQLNLAKLKQNNWSDLRDLSTLRKIIAAYAQATTLSLETKELFQAILATLESNPELYSSLEAKECCIIAVNCALQSVCPADFLRKSYLFLEASLKESRLNFTEIATLAFLFDDYKVRASGFLDAACKYLTTYLECEDKHFIFEKPQLTAIRNMGPIPVESLVILAWVFSKKKTDKEADTCLELVLKTLAQPEVSPFVPRAPYNKIERLAGGDLCRLAETYSSRVRYARELFMKILEQLKQDDWKKLRSLSRNMLLKLGAAFVAGKGELMTPEFRDVLVKLLG